MISPEFFFAARFFLLLTFLCPPAAVRGDDAVAAKMKELHRRFDADRDGVLASEEQERATVSVRDDHGPAWGRRIEQIFKQVAARREDRAIGREEWNREVDLHARGPEKKTVLVPMGDGTRLATDLYLPPGGGPFPAVLSRTPYGRVDRGRQGAGFAERGLVFVIQDMRGRFDSEGENLPFIGCGWEDHQDGADTVEWIRRQPWSDGGVATLGGSAGGITQNLLAAAAPAGLKGQYLSVAASNLYEDAAYTGGALRKADVENWTRDNKFSPRALELMRGHPAYDDYWKKFDSSRKFAEKNVPAVHLGGWFDMFAQGTLDEFAGRQHRGGPEGRGRQKLVMGPWAHGLGKMPVGELRFPDSGMPAHLNTWRWFEYCLLGVDNGVAREPAVTYYVMGDTETPGAPGNEWRQAEDWPVAATETAFYFHRDGRLAGGEPPAAGLPPLEYTFDPADPCPTIGGNNLTIPSGPRNQNRIENRPDVLLFSTEPLAAPVEVTGRVTAKIFLASSAVDTDLSVRLCDVYPDGRSFLIAEGMLRLRHRQSRERPAPLVPGRFEEVTVDCWSTSIVFNRGHRIRATVTSSNYPRFDINPGTGQPWSEDVEPVAQTNRIACDRDRPSRLLLPVAAGADSR